MKRTAVGLAAVAALGIAALIPSVGQSQGERTINLTSRSLSVKAVDLPPRRRVSAGDQLVAINLLRDADGKRVGTGQLSCGVTQAARTVERSTYQCIGTDRLKDGTITFAGVAKLSARAITVAVTGGTGVYDGAGGELVNTSTGRDTNKQLITLK
jgi:allene oxide cyclase-like protein